MKKHMRCQPNINSLYRTPNMQRRIMVAREEAVRGRRNWLEALHHEAKSLLLNVHLYNLCTIRSLVIYLPV